jgi:hypothetical protein
MTCLTHRRYNEIKLGNRFNMDPAAFIGLGA